MHFFFDPVAKKYGIFGWYQILPILVPNFTNSVKFYQFWSKFNQIVNKKHTHTQLKYLSPKALVSWVRILVPTQTQMIFWPQSYFSEIFCFSSPSALTISAETNTDHSKKKAKLPNGKVLRLFPLEWRIYRSGAESQGIETTRLLYPVQYPVPAKSSTKDCLSRLTI